MQGTEFLRVYFERSTNGQHKENGVLRTYFRFKQNEAGTTAPTVEKGFDR